MMEAILTILAIIFGLGVIISIAADDISGSTKSAAGMFFFGMLAIGEMGSQGTVIRLFAELPSKGLQETLSFFAGLFVLPLFFIMLGSLMSDEDEKKGGKE